MSIHMPPVQRYWACERCCLLHPPRSRHVCPCKVRGAFWPKRLKRLAAHFFSSCDSGYFWDDGASRNGDVFPVILFLIRELGAKTIFTKASSFCVKPLASAGLPSTASLSPVPNPAAAFVMPLGAAIAALATAVLRCRCGRFRSRACLCCCGILSWPNSTIVFIEVSAVLEGRDVE